MNVKGISPVIATILLIALTVAAVGIVAAILGTNQPPARPDEILFEGSHYDRVLSLHDNNVHVVYGIDGVTRFEFSGEWTVDPSVEYIFTGTLLKDFHSWNSRDFNYVFLVENIVEVR